MQRGQSALQIISFEHFEHHNSIEKEFMDTSEVLVDVFISNKVASNLFYGYQGPGYLIRPGRAYQPQGLCFRILLFFVAYRRILKHYRVKF